MREKAGGLQPIWSSLPDWNQARIEHDDWRAVPVSSLRQIMINGDVDTALTILAAGNSTIGLWGLAETDPYAVRLGRDRALLVSASPVEASVDLEWGGWHPDGWAFSPADDAFCVIDLAGEAAPELLSEGTSADLASSSPSAALLFAGIDAILYRRPDNVARLHVSTDMGAYLWCWLESR